MGPLWPHVNRWLTWFHRWSGVALCLLFIAWFVSGIVLLYVPFPALPESDRLAHSEPVDGSRVSLEPAAALARASGTEQLLLISVAGQPTYLAFSSSGAPMAISGDGAPSVLPLTATNAGVVAERFGNAPAIRVDGPLQYDQWVVHQRFDPFRPFFRVRLKDAERTDLYVSQRTGQVLQRTRGTERAWNWPGAVLHWIYFTPLRKSWSAWNQTVWWISLLGLAGSAAGTWLGLHRFLKTRASGRATWSPFRGWMKWHHVTGLFASVIVLVWVFSGWLSMDHGRLFSKGTVPSERATQFQGVSLESAASAVPPGFTRTIAKAAEIRFGAVGGRPLVAAQGGGLASRVFWLDGPQVDQTQQIGMDILVSALRTAWPGSEVAVPTDSAQQDFYAVAESLGATARPFIVAAPDPLRVYVDNISGRLLVVMDGSRRAYAWVYYALHTFNFPALLAHTAVRQTIVLVLMLIGLAFCGTGAVIGYQRLRRTIA